MRILMTNWNYVPEFSGAALQSHRLSLELIKMGINVDVLTGTDNSEMVGVDFVEGIKVTRVLRDKSTRLKHMRYGWQLFRYILKNRKEYDIIHSHGFIAPVNLAAKLSRIPLVQKITNMNVDDPVTVSNRKFGHLLMSLFESSKVLIPTSRLLENTCESHLCHGHYYSRLPNGVDPHVFKPVPDDIKTVLRKKLSLPEDHIILLMVGSVNYVKGTDSLVEMLHVLKKTADKKFTLVILGPNKLCRSYALGKFQVDRFTQNLLKLVSDYSLYKNIRFEGVMPNVQEYMQAADIYVHSSRQEGQPNAILEAMSSALPIVANLIPGITDELLQNGHSGYVVENNDPVKFAAAVRVLMNNEKLRYRMAACARVEVLQNYNLWKIAEKYRSLYARILNNDPLELMPEHNTQSILAILNSIKPH